MKNKLLTFILLCILTVTGCQSVDDARIPSVAVYVPFITQADWETYGVTGACQWRTFIKSNRQPSNYNYSALSSTGYGGVLLVSDINGEPRAYDLACPVEAKYDVRLTVDADLLKARCPKCGSIFDIFTNYGAPVQGQALDYHYGLRRLNVCPGQNGEYRIIAG